LKEGRKGRRVASSKGFAWEVGVSCIIIWCELITTFAIQKACAKEAKHGIVRVQYRTWELLAVQHSTSSSNTLD
jgi:hypothetical protein